MDNRIKQLNRYSDIFLINMLSIIIGIWLYFFTNEKVEILGAVIATGISLSLGVRQYKTENDKIFKELFYEFNSKYDHKFNEKLNEIVERTERGENADSNDEDKKDKEIIIDYLNFCAEEYLWNTMGRIPPKVWDAWENGMIYYINKPPINKIVREEMDQRDSYYGLFDKIDKRIKPISETP